MQIRKEIVDKFFERGHLLTPDALEFIRDSKNYQKLVEASSLFDKLIIEKEDFETFETKTDSIKVVMNLSEKPSELTPELFNSFLVSKFEKMKTLFMERTDKNFISLDKIDNYRNEVFVIGMIKEIVTDESGITLEIEDRTKSIKAIFNNYAPKTSLDEEDVIGIRGIGSKEVIFGKEIIYPDVPLREPTKGTGRICVISDLHLDEAPKDRLVSFLKWIAKEDIKYLFVAGDTRDLKMLSEMVNEHAPEKTVFVIPGNMDDSSYPALPMEPAGNLICLSNPSMVEINGIKVLAAHKFDQVYLKKRYLGKTSVILKEDYLVLNEIPDIVVCGHTHEPSVSNYKSITIANPGSLLADFKPTIINLETREYQQTGFD